MAGMGDTGLVHKNVSAYMAMHLQETDEQRGAKAGALPGDDKDGALQEAVRVWSILFRNPQNEVTELIRRDLRR